MGIDIDLSPPTKNNCKGLVFRGYSSTYAVNGGVGVRQGVRLLKRKSCPGCEFCGGMWDCIDNAIIDGDIIIPAIENGAMYSVRLANCSTDWETGFVDQCDVEIFKIKAV